MAGNKKVKKLARALQRSAGLCYTQALARVRSEPNPERAGETMGVDPNSVAAALIKKAVENRRRDAELTEKELKPRWDAAVSYLCEVLSEVPVRTDIDYSFPTGDVDKILAIRDIQSDLVQIRVVQQIDKDTDFLKTGVELVVAVFYGGKYGTWKYSKVVNTRVDCDINSVPTWSFPYDSRNAVSHVEYELRILEEAVSILKSASTEAQPSVE